MGQLFRKIIQWIPLLFFAGSVLLQFFVILSGARTTGVLKDFYWLEVEGTGAIDPQFGTTRWTNYRMCNWENDELSNCEGPQPAYPFSPDNNFSDGENRALIPSDFINHRDTYYYLSRVGWSMLLVGLVFTVFSFFSTLLRIFLKWKLVSGLNWLNSVFAVFFVALGASLMTAAYVKGRNSFNDASEFDASLGGKMFAFLWTSLALLLLSLPIFCFKKPLSSFHGGTGTASHDDSIEYKEDYIPPATGDAYNPEPAGDYPPTQKRKLNFFKINRKTTIED